MKNDSCKTSASTFSCHMPSKSKPHTSQCLSLAILIEINPLFIISLQTMTMMSSFNTSIMEKFKFQENPFLLLSTALGWIYLKHLFTTEIIKINCCVVYDELSTNCFPRNRVEHFELGKPRGIVRTPRSKIVILRNPLHFNFISSFLSSAAFNFHIFLCRFHVLPLSVMRSGEFSALALEIGNNYHNNG